MRTGPVCSTLPRADASGIPIGVEDTFPCWKTPVMVRLARRSAAAGHAASTANTCSVRADMRSVTSKVVVEKITLRCSRRTRAVEPYIALVEQTVEDSHDAVAGAGASAENSRRYNNGPSVSKNGPRRAPMTRHLDVVPSSVVEFRSRVCAPEVVVGDRRAPRPRELHRGEGSGLARGDFSAVSR